MESQIDALKERAERAEGAWRRLAEFQLARIALQIELRRDISGARDFVAREMGKRTAAQERYAAALAAISEMGDLEVRP